MTLQQFITDKDLNTFDKIKNIFTKEPYNMYIKGNNDRCILLLNNSTITKFTSYCDGCIIDIPNKKVICYSPHFERVELEYNKEREDTDMKWDNVSIEELIDGTMIRLYYDNEWKIATHRTIDASNAYWISSKSFKDLFMECADKLLNFKLLNQNNIYGFIIRHPENKIVTHYELKDLVHIFTLDRNNNFKEIKQDLKIIKPTKFIFTTYSQMISSCLNLPFYLPGYLITNNNNKIKYISPQYNYVKNLKGNNSNIEMIYLQNRNTLQANELLLYYPEYTIIAQNIETKIITKCNDLYNKYIDIKIKKKWYDLDNIDKQLIFKIHEYYLSTKNRINFQDVYEVFNKFPHYKIKKALNI